MKVSIPAFAARCLLCGAPGAQANVEGLPDPFFGYGGYRVYDFPTQPFHADLLHGTAVTADQRIVSAGTVNVGDDSVSPNPIRIGVSRFLADGGADPSFGSGAGQFALARLGFDGTLDGAFGIAGKSHFTADVDADGSPNSVGIDAMVQQRNQLLIGGSTQVRRFAAPAESDFMLGRVLLKQYGADLLLIDNRQSRA